MHFKDPFFDALTKRVHTLSDTAQGHQLEELKVLIQHIRQDCDKALSILGTPVPTEQEVVEHTVAPSVAEEKKELEQQHTIEGFFDGLNMCDDQGKQYVVPPNYASKSKLVEGDRMKLTISEDGSFMFKQIRLTPRRRVVGALGYHQESRSHIVEAEGRCWKILGASVSFYHARQGDEIVVLVSAEKDCAWAAVDNVIHK